MSKKTAVEWLIDEIDQMQKICDNLTKKELLKVYLKSKYYE